MERGIQLGGRIVSIVGVLDCLAAVMHSNSCDIQPYHLLFLLYNLDVEEDTGCFLARKKRVF